MKYILIFLLSFALIHPAYAARMVKGSVPVVQPLEPPAAGIGPDLSHNIQLQSPSSAGQSAQGQQQVQPSASAALGQQVQVQAVAHPVYKKSSDWLWWLLIIFGLLLLGFMVKRKQPRQ